MQGASETTLDNSLDLPKIFSLILQLQKRVSHLKESLEPPDLKDALSNQHAELKNAPPFYPCIRALCSVPMRSLPNHDVALLVFHLCQEFR